MAEREPPSSSHDAVPKPNPHELLPPDRQLSIRPEPNPDDEFLPADRQLSIRPTSTYVVQFPKDQVYRVPPPENALIVEQHQKAPPNKTNSRACCGCSCFTGCFIFIAVVILIIGLVIGVSFLLFKSKVPNFNVRHVLVNRTESSPPKYRISVQVQNPNGNAGIVYNKGGRSWLSWRQQEIAVGTYPTFVQNSHNSTAIVVVLDGSKHVLPKEIERSMKSQKTKVHVSLSLKMNVPMNLVKGIFSHGDFSIVVKCDFLVDSLAKNTRILSQICETQRQA